MLGIQKQDIIDRHTDELREVASAGIELFEMITSHILTEDERKIYEIAYGNGFSDSKQYADENIEVLKDQTKKTSHSGGHFFF